MYGTGDTVRVLQKAKSHTNFRPETHNRLIRHDDLFVYRYSSFCHCSEIIQQVKKDVFDNYASKSLNEFTKRIDEIKQDIFNEYNVYVCQYNSVLSDPDREFMLNRMFSLYTEKVLEDVEVLFCPVSYYSTITCESLLCEIAESISSQLRNKNALPKRFLSTYMQNLKKDDPFEYITEILTTYHSEHIVPSIDDSNQQNIFTTRRKLQLIIPFPFYEKFQNMNILSLLIDKFYQYKQLNSTTCHWNTIFFVEFFVKRKLPIHFSSNIMDILQQEFFGYQMCLSTLIQRVSQLVKAHYERRKSLLCMFMEWEWLQSLHIMKGISGIVKQTSSSFSSSGVTSTAEESVADIVSSSVPVESIKQDIVTRSIGELLSLLKASDFPEKSVFIYRNLKDPTFSKEQELKRIRQEFDCFNEVRLFLRVMFPFFKYTRDIFLNSKQKQQLSIPNLWKGMTDSSSSPKLNLFLTEFSKTVLEQYTQISFERLFTEYLETMMKDFMAIPIMKQFQLTMFKDFFQDFQENIEFLLQTLELLKENIFSQATPAPDQPAHETSPEPKEIVDVQASSAEAAGRLYSLSFQQLKSHHQNKNWKYFKDNQLSVFLAEVIIPLEEDGQGEEDKARDEEEWIGEKTQKSTPQKQNVFKTTNFHLLEEFMNDLHSWLKHIFESYARLISFPKEWSGVLVIDAQDEHLRNEFLFASKDVVRKRFVSDLLQDAKLPAEELATSNSTDEQERKKEKDNTSNNSLSFDRETKKLLPFLFHRIQYAQPTEVAMNWFLAYQQSIEPSKNAPDEPEEMAETATKKSRKRKKTDDLDDKPEPNKKKSSEPPPAPTPQQLSLSLPVRCEIASTLYDLEKNGFISMKKGEGKNVAIVKTMYTGVQL